MAKAKSRKKRKVKAGVKRSPVKRKKRSTHKRKKRPASRKRSPVKRRNRRRSVGKRVVKQVEKKTVERVIQGRRKRRTHRRKVRMAGPSRRRRSVSGTGNTGLLVGLAVGAAALYFLTKGSGSTTTQNYGSLPPLTTTGNYTRDTQSQQIVQYAMAAGMALSAITSLIQSLNTSTDAEVKNTYDQLQVYDYGGGGSSTDSGDIWA